MRAAVAIVVCALAGAASAMEMAALPERGLLRLMAEEARVRATSVPPTAAIEVDISSVPLAEDSTIDLFGTAGLILAEDESPSDFVFLSGPAADYEVYYDAKAEMMRAHIGTVHSNATMKVTVWGAGASTKDVPAQYWDHATDGTWSAGVPGEHDTALFIGDAFAYGWMHTSDNRVPPIETLALRGGRLVFKSGRDWPFITTHRVVGRGVLALSGTGLQSGRGRTCTVSRGVTVESEYFSLVQDSWLMGNGAPLVLNGPVAMSDGFLRVYKGVVINGPLKIDSPYGPGKVERGAGCEINGDITVCSPFVVASGNKINGTVFMDGGTLTIGDGVEMPKVEAVGGRAFAVRHVNDDVMLTPVFWTPARIVLLVAVFVAVIAFFMGVAFFFGVKMMRRTQQLKEAFRSRELERVAYDAARRERLRLSMDLHDDFQQLLTSARFRLVAGTTFVADGDVGAGREQLDAARAALDYAQTGLRATLWTMSEESEGPGSLLDLFRHAIGRMAHWQGVVELDQDGEEPKLARRLMGRLLMILQEAVGNAITHGDATKVRVKVAFAEKSLTMTVSDNGDGFDPASISAERGHFGIRSMEARAHEGNGTLAIDSAPGRGTTVTATFPY